MPVDDRNDAPEGGRPDPGDALSKSEIKDALQSETDEPLPPAAERMAERDAASPHPVTPQGKRRRWVTRRNAFILTISLAIIAVCLVLLAVLFYRLGYVDRYIARQIKDTFAQYGIRAEIKEFHTSGARNVEMNDVELYDAATNERLGRIDKLTAVVRIEDLYALNLRRNINLEELKIDGVEVWVKFDAEGNSNFRNIKLPAPDPNRRILFSYSTARIEINNGVIHYGDERHDISGEARNLVATIQPDNPNAPAESWMNTVTLSASNSTFVYDGRPVNNIDVTARGRINQTRAEIQELTLRSPLAEARLTGVMDDWRALRYNLNVTSTVDLTQASDILQPGTALRGVGNFVGTINGEGHRYNVDGEIKSDAMAADGVRVQALTLTAKGSGVGTDYDELGRAVAELLSSGDFQLTAMQVTGGVVGTGTDFRWVGELRSAAARYQGTSITGLILSDAVAEMREGVLTANARRAAANGITTSEARINAAQASDVRVRSENGVTTATAGTVQAGTVMAEGGQVKGVTADGVDVVDRNGVTNVAVNRLSVGGVQASGATIGSLNIAGVRLSIRAGGRVEGTSGDINAGNVQIAKSKDFEGGTIRDVRLARPVFVLEPSGRYRASADLSLGGGVLASVQLGAARAALTASNNQVELRNFNAQILNGSASGNAVINTARGSSRVQAAFNDLDVNQIVALTAKRNVPISGKATGTADLSFRGTDFKNTATGTVRADFTGETGTDATGTNPLTGTVALNARTPGLFEIERANLRTQSSELTASGRFSFARDESDLRVDLNAADASELQNVISSTGLLPSLEAQLNTYNVALDGRLTFNGTVRGRLENPSVEGRASLETLIVNGRELGTLTAALNLTPAEINVTDGKLAERDGGGVQFTLNAPRTGTNNISVDATLDRANAGNLLAAFQSGDTSIPGTTPSPAQLSDLQADVSGRIKISGFPDAMSGDANLRVGPGYLSGEHFDSITAQATFTGSKVNLNRVDARFDAGTIVAQGNYDTHSKEFDITANGTGIQLNRLTAFARGAGGVPQISGTADINAHATGIFTDFSTYVVTIDGTGRDVRINGREAGQLSLVGRTQDRQFNLSLTTGILGQPQVITASVDLGNKLLPAKIETNFANADLTGLFAALLPPGTAVTVTGRASGRLSAEGNLYNEDEGAFSFRGLRGTANFTNLTVQVEDVQLSAVSPLLVQFSGDEIFFEKTQFTGTGTNVLFGGTLAVGPGGHQNLTVNGQLNLRVLNGLSPDFFLAGTADVRVSVGGTYEEPRLNGSASVAGASLSAIITDQRLQMSNIEGRVIFNSNFAQISSLTGTLGGGRVNVTGGAQLLGFMPRNFRFSVHGDQVTVPYPEGFRTTADADLEINGSRSPSTGVITTFISGPVTLRRAEYTQDIELADLINQRREASLTEGSGEGALAATTQLDLRIEGRDALVVRNNLADVVGSVSLRVTGPVEDPIVAGRITASRGTLNFRRERYEVTRGFIDLPAQRDADPILNIQAESEIRGYRVIADLTGPLSQPSATVRSDPALPQVDVVSLILTGELSQEGTGTSVLAQSGVGTAASLLANTIINEPLRRATSKLYGLSLELDPLIAGRGGASPTARLRVTQPISKELSVTYSTNVTSDQNQILAVEYRVSDRLSFVAQYEQGSANGFSSRNDNFSFEIRFRKRF
ncbi:MAG: translocation/assembly module TamB domain-containing protein [Pyrinomonadaceae bacterium]|nr:translocation/assembly module TamB domain-containing protein [Pyrinomonadaceae bacterium]